MLLICVLYVGHIYIIDESVVKIIGFLAGIAGVISRENIQRQLWPDWQLTVPFAVRRS
jgi:hypothetical protein